jgi:phage terminase large subunit
MTEPARIVIPNRFKARPYQRRFMRHFDKGGKRAMWVLHRRGGKDLTALHQTCKMMHERKAGYWHIFPTAEQGRKALWEGFTKDGERIMEQVFPSPIRKSPRAFLPNSEMVVELKCGSIWRLMGSDKMEVVGAGPAGVVFSEFALSKPKTWDLVRPMLRENDGWAAFITTPRGRNHAFALYEVAKKDPSWFCELQTLYDTRAYDPDATIAEERASGMPEALIRQEYLCDWSAALVGSVFGDLVELLEKNGRIADFDHEKDGIFTSWDLGFTDATAIWFWRVALGGVDVVDYYEAHGQPLSHYFDVLESKRKEFGYQYVKHWLPHDAAARTLATGTSIEDQFVRWAGRSSVQLGPSLSLLDGIQAARWLLQRNVRIHARCEEGVNALRLYRYGYDEDTKAFSKKPLHDWTSHGADSWRYLAIVAKHTEEMMRKEEPPKAQPYARTLNGGFTLEEVWEANQGPRRERL